MIELTEIQEGIFEKVKSNWEERVGRGNVDEDVLKKIIVISDIHGDGKKRVKRRETGELFLVPIEDILLIGVKEEELDKYPKEDN